MFKKLKILLYIVSALTFIAGISLAFYINANIPRSDISDAELYMSGRLNANNAELVMEGVKALYYHENYLYCAKGYSIVKTKDFGRTYEHVADVEYDNLPWFCKPLKGVGIFRRIARMDVYRLRLSPNGNIALTAKGGVYLIKKGESKAKLVSATKGSRPISLTVDDEGRFYYGEYLDNPEREKIDVYRSSPDGTNWEIVYTFPKQTIRHVHSIEYDKYDNCFWIATGDINSDTFLIRASKDFKTIDRVLQGGQENRFFEIKILKDRLFLTPDAPNGEDYITILEKKSGKDIRLFHIEGVTFFSAIIGDYFICATSNEPYAKGRCEYLNTHVWAVNLNTLEYRKIAIFPTDFYYRFSLMEKICPAKGLFQFSNAFFPEGINDKSKILIYGNGLADINGSTFIWDASKYLNF